MRLFARLSIKSKLIILLFMIALPFITSMYFLYVQSSKVILKNAVDSNNQLIDQASRYLDNYFDDTERIVMPLVANPAIWKFMDGIDQDPYTRYVLTKPIVEDLFPGIMINKQDILALSLVTEKYAASSSFSYMNAQQRYLQYKDRIGEIGKFQFVGLSSINNVPAVTIAIKFANPRNKAVTAMLIVDLRLESINQLVDEVKIGRTGMLYIVDSLGQFISNPDPFLRGKFISKTLLERMDKSQYSYFVDTSAKAKKLVVYKLLDRTGWIIATEVPMNELSGDLSGLRDMTVVMISLVLLGAFALITGGSLSITSAILRLQALMKKAEGGDLSVKAPEGRGDEIGSLFASFNKMVSEIGNLTGEVNLSLVREREMELKQKEAKLQTMQSQINPHFLYNTLELINSHAILLDVMPVSKMAVGLARFFRYSISSSSADVSLKDEIDHTMAYLEIQKERHQSLTVELDTGDIDTNSVKAVKLILQPIVENIFKHGYESAGIKPTFIRMKAESSGGYCLFTVEDRGRGMTDEMILGYNRVFSGEGGLQPGALNEPGETNHIGLMNVHERIQMAFGGECGLRVEKAVPSGLKVLAILRYRQEETSGGGL